MSEFDDRRLSPQQMAGATRLEFEAVVSPHYDREIEYTDFSATGREIYEVTLVAGYSYNLWSNSFFKESGSPDVHDQNGIYLGGYGDFQPYYTGKFYITPDWDPGSYYDNAFLRIREDQEFPEEDRNHSPIANDDYYTVEKGEDLWVDPTENDTDPDGGGSPGIQDVNGIEHGTAVEERRFDPPGKLFYRPNPDFVGIETFTYMIVDYDGGADTATITITVTDGNTPPSAISDIAETQTGKSIEIDVLSNDIDADGHSLEVTDVTNPGNGSASINSDNQTVYTPNSGFTGVDTFSYTIDDGNGGTDSALVSVSVNAFSVPDTPNFFGILMESTPPQVITSGTYASIIDAAGSQSLHLDEGASLNFAASSGSNVITMQAASNEIQISHDVATFLLEGPNGEKISLTARNTPQTFVFLDGAAEMVIDGDSITIGDQVVSETPSSFAGEIDNSVTSESVFSDLNIFM